MNEYETEVKRKRIVFEPDFELPEEEMEYVEDQIANKVKEKLGDDYEAVDWRWDTKMTVFAEKRK
jgi:hypothetical protein